ncbi:MULTISPECIES: hypothetical protein [Mesorhizobium]|uniref:Uncharacterized protein n=1 Tax=Rhizobium loti TaxID=381 RepID=A0A8E3B7B5_RHILI|nr:MULTISPECIES: hypothetical protein [Mesorhizobium]PWJ93922.1 hypothetical protein C8D77_101602 [Mesorhizobium loti]
MHRILLLGTGGIAGHHVEEFAGIPGCSIGALATIVASRYMTGHANDLSLALHGTRGAIKVETDGKVSNLSACLGGDVDLQRWQTLALPSVKRNARRFADALDSGRNGDPSFRRAADMQKLIDAAFESSAAKLPISIA